MRSAHIAVFVATVGLCGSGFAQKYRDLTLVRGRPSPWASVIEARAGVLGSLADDENKAIGLEDTVSWDGYAYYRQDQFGGRQATLDLYAGRDGAYFGVTEGELWGGETQSRLEVHTRYFPFYREGFYRSEDFVPTGRYEGFDWGASLGVAQDLGEGLRLEMSAFFRRNTFDRNEDTATNYVIPDDYSAYGGRVTLEHATLTLDRLTGRPEQGFILTLAAEREQNDSDRVFGVTGVYESSLPSGFWRGFGHMEWYLPQSDSMTWELIADGQITDREDRVFNFDAQKPLGHLWIDGQLRFRMEFGQAFWVTPFGQAQLVKVLEQGGIASSQEVFFGGGLDLGVDFGDSLGLVAEYSYLSNESRAPVSTSDDTYGEHRFFFGVEARFGGQRR